MLPDLPRTGKHNQQTCLGRSPDVGLALGFWGRTLLPSAIREDCVIEGTATFNVRQRFPLVDHMDVSLCRKGLICHQTQCDTNRS